MFLAPSAPLEVIFGEIKEHSFIVYWKKPADENGELKSYRIRYSFQNGTHTVSNITEVNDVVDKFELKNLYSFVTYNVEVQAKTVEYGPFSEAKPCKTVESSKYLFLACLDFCNLDFYRFLPLC